MPKIVVHIQANLTWKWGRTKQGNYVGRCASIGQTVQADNFGELFETINEALDSTFRELLSTGDLKSFLNERGWSSNRLPAEPKNIRFDVPFDLKGVRNRDLEEAVC